MVTDSKHTYTTSSSGYTGKLISSVNEADLFPTSRINLAPDSPCTNERMQTTGWAPREGQCRAEMVKYNLFGQIYYSG